MRLFGAALAVVVLLPIVGAGGYTIGQRLAPESELAGLVQVSTDSHYGWVVTAGKYKGQTTDPAIVLQYAKRDRPPSAFKRLTCVVYATGEPVALSPRAVQVCHAETVLESEVRAALHPGKNPPPPGVPAMP